MYFLALFSAFWEMETIFWLFRFEYFEETIGTHVSIEDCSSPVTNYAYEERIQEKKRTIKILKPKYLNLVFENIKDML